MPDDSQTQQLRELSGEFRRLHDEHQECERRLADLSQQSSLSEEDELAAKQIKRHKLFLKDRMEQIAHSQQAATTAA